jgi:putative Holliday junction resolvase
MSRWLGIDHGTRRIGIAAGGTSDGIATPVTAVGAEPPASAFAKIRQLAADYGAEGVVVGWPLNMDGSEGPQGRLAREMARQLAEATGLDVRLWDERLSSFAADEALAGTYTRKKKKARHDAVAASIMLGHFLTADGPATAPRPGEAAAEPPSSSR